MGKNRAQHADQGSLSPQGHEGTAVRAAERRLASQ